SRTRMAPASGPARQRPAGRRLWPPRASCRSRSPRPSVVAGAEPRERRARGPALLDLQQVDVEDERLVRPDRRRLTLRPVRHVGRDDELAAPADLHSDDALVPPGDDHAGTQLELERLVAVPRGVELLPARPGDPHVL